MAFSAASYGAPGYYPPGPPIYQGGLPGGATTFPTRAMGRYNALAPTASFGANTLEPTAKSVAASPTQISVGTQRAGVAAKASSPIPVAAATQRGGAATTSRGMNTLAPNPSSRPQLGPQPGNQLGVLAVGFRPATVIDSTQRAPAARPPVIGAPVIQAGKPAVISRQAAITDSSQRTDIGSPKRGSAQAAVSGEEFVAASLGLEKGFIELILAKAALIDDSKHLSFDTVFGDVDWSKQVNYIVTSLGGTEMCTAKLPEACPAAMLLVHLEKGDGGTQYQLLIDGGTLGPADALPPCKEGEDSVTLACVRQDACEVVAKPNDSDEARCSKCNVKFKFHVRHCSICGGKHVRGACAVCQICRGSGKCATCDGEGMTQKHKDFIMTFGKKQEFENYGCDKCGGEKFSLVKSRGCVGKKGSGRCQACKGSGKNSQASK